MHFFTIRNTSHDRAKVAQHRTAPGFTPEVSIGGTRLSPGYQININPEHFERIKEQLFKLYNAGSIEVFEGKTAEGAPDVRFMIPEKAPVAETNPHGVYNPLKAEDLEKQQPPALPPENPPIGDVLSRDVPPGPPPVEDVVPPRPPIEEAVLPGEVLPREAHVQTNPQEESTRPIETSTPVSGEEAGKQAPPAGPPPETTEPRRPENPGGKKKKLM